MAENRSLLLIVEDHAPTRERLTSLLGRAGWDVRAASSEAEGLAMLDSEPRWHRPGPDAARRQRRGHPAAGAAGPPRNSGGSGDRQRRRGPAGVGAGPEARGGRPQALRDE